MTDKPKRRWYTGFGASALFGIALFIAYQFGRGDADNTQPFWYVLLGAVIAIIPLTVARYLDEREYKKYGFSS